MAEHAGNIAKSLGLEHITVKLPWGQNSFPKKPGPGEKIEGIARAMRYRAISDHLKSQCANVVALGHHADDQVETMLMRLGRGASNYGLAGMRPCRRWGMGDTHHQQYGLSGLTTWVIRPLLFFGKDRILATCRQNKLQYVKDPTNFQPEITLRNAIRRNLRENQMCQFARLRATKDNHLSKEVAQGLQTIREAAEAVDLGFNLNTPLTRLRRANRDFTSQIREQEESTDRVIERYRLPSPPGSFMISADDLDKIHRPAVRESFLFRITRYVSPEPWGDPRAELGRRKSSVQRLMGRLWSVNKIDTSICVGSHVWWRPVTIKRDRVLATVENNPPTRLGWLAQRQPPESRLSLDLLTFKITKEDLSRWKTRNREKGVELLYDLRFSIRIRPDKIPEDILSVVRLGGTLVIESGKPWFLPEISLRGDNVNQCVHTFVVWPYEWRKAFRYHKDEIDSDWATIEYIRPISAI